MDAINSHCETPLVTAILANNSDMVKYLLESGANPNCSQCLHHAVSEGKQNLHGANTENSLGLPLFPKDT